jgi:hypothetical protein
MLMFELGNNRTTNRTTLRSWGVLLALLLALAGLAACGDDPQPTPTPTNVPATATVPALSTPTAMAELPLAVEITTTDNSLVPLEAAPASTEAVTDAIVLEGTTEISPTDPGAEIEQGCEIEPNPDLIGYDAVIAKLGCPIAEASNDPVGINEFGEGPNYKRFMLWFGGEGQIYVLSDDGRWLAYTDTWQDTEPEIFCNPENLNPPASPPLPRRGFGKLWCSVETVQSAMGYIDREERLCQHAVVQRFERGRLLACFEDATIRYFRILENGAWDMEMVQ